MSNITMSVDEDLIRKVRKVAVEKNTTLSSMVREFLQTVAQREDSRKRQSLQHLAASFTQLSRNMGRHTWTREQLHGR